MIPSDTENTTGKQRGKPFVKGKSGIKIHFENFILKLKIVKEIFAIGMSSFARMVAGSIMSIMLNHSLAYYGGELAIAALGIINRLLGVVMMPMFGLVQGMQPIVGYNYGAKNYHRTRKAVLLSTKAISILSIGLFAILMIFSKSIIKVFTTDLALITLSNQAAKIMLFLLPIIGFQIVTAGMYQSTGKAGKAFFLSILRQVVILMPLIFIVPLFFGLNGIFIAFPASDFLAGAIILIVLLKDLKKLKLNKKL